VEQDRAAARRLSDRALVQHVAAFGASAERSQRFGRRVRPREGDDLATVADEPLDDGSADDAAAARDEDAPFGHRVATAPT
jgi:hypothetical protein